ncbi:MAG: hypothetical protein K2N95_17720 [Lachnospiraceae bacterium]|nr:hypothetical protein [Lachnospiraceae bacterium]
MRKLVFVLSIAFVMLTFLGSGYVLFCDGKANAGYAVVPMVLALACISFCRQKNK